MQASIVLQYKISKDGRTLFARLFVIQENPETKDGFGVFECSEIIVIISC